MGLLQDLRYAFRSLRNAPGFALTAILALALGIGANSAMFSIIDGVLLEPLPFPHSDRLVNLWETNPVRNAPRLIVAPANYHDWRAANHVFERMGAYQQATFNLASHEGEPERFLGAICDPGFFATLQISPVLGRLFNDDEMPDGRDAVVLLSYGVWKQRFGGDRGVIGRTLVINGKPRSVIGVLPEAFQFPGQSVMWAPFGFDNDAASRRDLHRLRVIARLKDGVALERARSEFATIGARLASQYPFFNKGEGVAVNPMLEDVTGAVRPALLVLLSAVVFVLLIACANVANLLLSKASARRREISVRAALGASRARMVRQMLTESAVLAGSGGALGLLFAYAILRALKLLGAAGLGAATIPRLNEAGLDGRVIGFTLLVSICTAMLFGLAPAWQASKADVSSLMKDASRGATSRGRLRDLLVIAQVACAVVLLTGAGLLIRSVYEVERVDPGFNPDRLMTMQLAPAGFKYAGHEDLLMQLARGILDKVGALPGVTSAAISTSVPLLGNPIYIMRFEGRPPVNVSEAPLANYFAVTPDFFKTMGMHIVRGRAINERDTAASPFVAVVNQTLVDRYYPGQDPIGKRLEVVWRTPPMWREIVGVVADVRTAGLDQDTPVQVYTAYLQKPTLAFTTPSPLTVLARTAGDPAAIASPMKNAILSVDRSQPVYAMQPMTTVVSQSIAQRRLSLLLLAFFAISALFLAALGLYGVISYSVAQRTGEIGIRMALGAHQTQVLLLIERQGMTIVLAGVGAGVAGALLLTRLMTGLLFQVQPSDPATFGGVIAVLLVVSMLACLLPARRASRVDPIVALRHE